MVSLDLWRNNRGSRSPQSLWKTWDSITHDFDTFFEDIDRALGGGNVSENRRDRQEMTFSPVADIEETENAYLLSFDMPGFKPEELNIDLSGRTLTVTGKRQRESNDNKLHRSEKFYGEYRRAITLAENINSEDIQANYENGVLSLTLPKAQLAQSRKIEIGMGAGQGRSNGASQPRNTEMLGKEQDKQRQQEATH